MNETKTDPTKRRNRQIYNHSWGDGEREKYRVRVRDIEKKRGKERVQRHSARETEHALDHTERGSGHRAWSQSSGFCQWDPGGGAAGWVASLTRCPMEPWGPGSPRSPCVGGRKGMELDLGEAPKTCQNPPPGGRFSTHSLALLSWVAGDSFGSSGAWGSLSNKTGPQPRAWAG